MPGKRKYTHHFHHVSVCSSKAACPFLRPCASCLMRSHAGGPGRPQTPSTDGGFGALSTGVLPPPALPHPGFGGGIPVAVALPLPSSSPPGAAVAAPLAAPLALPPSVVATSAVAFPPTGFPADAGRPV